MEHTLITGPDAGPLAVKAAGFVADRIRLAEHDRPWSSVEIDQVEVPGDRSIPAARVQARRSVIFADAPAVDGPPPTFQGAIFDIDGALVHQALTNAGADLVVRTLGEVSCPALGEGRLARKTEG